MPRYYFDVTDSAGFHRDEFGDDFDTFEEARAQAQVLLHTITRDQLFDSDMQQVTCLLRDDIEGANYREVMLFRGVLIPQLREVTMGSRCLPWPRFEFGLTS
ncbi:MAG: DUF6894 family protein [Janthinobacterium lividum]